MFWYTSVHLVSVSWICSLYMIVRNFVKYPVLKGFLGGSGVKNTLASAVMWVWSLGQKYPLEKERAIHSSILAWEIPWMDESSGPQSKRLQRVGSQIIWQLNNNNVLYWEASYCMYIICFHCSCNLDSDITIHIKYHVGRCEFFLIQCGDFELAYCKIFIRTFLCTATPIYKSPFFFL